VTCNSLEVFINEVYSGPGKQYLVSTSHYTAESVTDSVRDFCLPSSSLLEPQLSRASSWELLGS
jgi:hypothetical protein